MRRVISAMLVFLVGFMLLFGASCAWVFDNIRVEDCKVEEVSDGIVVLCDTQGNLWEICADGMEIGEEVKAVFSNNGTECVLDDIVVRVF